MCNIKGFWYVTLGLLLATATLFILPVRYAITHDPLYSLLYYVHLKNYIRGKTTNERFAKKAQASFSEAGEGEGTTTYMDGKSDSES